MSKPKYHEGVRVAEYVPVSESLKADRRWEQETSWQTIRERKRDLSDLLKDHCPTCMFVHHPLSGYQGERIGVPESYSHLYDAQAIEQADGHSGDAA